MGKPNFELISTRSNCVLRSSKANCKWLTHTSRRSWGKKKCSPAILVRGRLSRSRTEFKRTIGTNGSQLEMSSQPLPTTIAQWVSMLQPTAGTTLTRTVTGDISRVSGMAGRLTSQSVGRPTAWACGVGIQDGGTHGFRASRGDGCLSIMACGTSMPRWAGSGCRAHSGCGVRLWSIGTQGPAGLAGGPWGLAAELPARWAWRAASPP